MLRLQSLINLENIHIPNHKSKVIIAIVTAISLLLKELNNFIDS